MKPEHGKFIPANGLDTQDVSHLIGGEIENNSFVHGTIYVGEICRAVVDGNLLRLGFSLVLNGERNPLFPKEWKRDDTRNSCVIRLSDYTVADIGPGIDGGEGNRWVLLSADKLTMAILYPSNGRKFDAERLKELLATPVVTPPKGPPTCRVSGAKACN